MTFKQSLREELERLQGENCQHTWKPVNPKECDKCKKQVDEALSATISLISKELPKEKDFPKDVSCIANPNYEQDRGFNQCLSEIRKEIGI